MLEHVDKLPSVCVAEYFTASEVLPAAGRKLCVNPLGLCVLSPSSTLYSLKLSICGPICLFDDFLIEYIF